MFLLGQSSTGVYELACDLQQKKHTQAKMRRNRNNGSSPGLATSLSRTRHIKEIATDLD